MIRDLGLIVEGELRNDFATGVLVIGDCPYILALITSRFPLGTRVRITVEPLPAELPAELPVDLVSGPLLIPPR